LALALSKLNQFLKFFKCWNACEIYFTKPFNISDHTFSMLLIYRGKLKVHIFSKFDRNNVHIAVTFRCTHFVVSHLPTTDVLSNSCGTWCQWPISPGSNVCLGHLTCDCMIGSKLARFCPLCDGTIAGPLWWPVWCRLVTVPTDPLTRPTAHFCSNGQSANPETLKNGIPVLPIANPTADSESGSLVCYSSFQ